MKATHGREHADLDHLAVREVVARRIPPGSAEAGSCGEGVVW
jgi:hypothetical protein